VSRRSGRIIWLKSRVTVVCILLIVVLTTLSADAFSAQQSPSKEAQASSLNSDIESSEEAPSTVEKLMQLRSPFSVFSVNTEAEHAGESDFTAMVVADMTMVGSLVYRDQRWALMRAVDGVTHRIQEGQEIGAKGVRVLLITPLSVIFSEPFEDASGAQKMRLVEVFMGFR
jgi:Tfp pilus assembly protein PilP